MTQYFLGWHCYQRGDVQKSREHFLQAQKHGYGAASFQLAKLHTSDNEQKKRLIYEAVSRRHMRSSSLSTARYMECCCDFMKEMLLAVCHKRKKKLRAIKTSADWLTDLTQAYGKQLHHFQLTFTSKTVIDINLPFARSLTLCFRAEHINTLSIPLLMELNLHRFATDTFPVMPKCEQLVTLHVTGDTSCHLSSLLSWMPNLLVLLLSQTNFKEEDVSEAGKILTKHQSLRILRIYGGMFMTKLLSGPVPLQEIFYREHHATLPLDLWPDFFYATKLSSFLLNRSRMYSKGCLRFLETNATTLEHLSLICKDFKTPHLTILWHYIEKLKNLKSLVLDGILYPECFDDLCGRLQKLPNLTFVNVTVHHLENMRPVCEMLAYKPLERVLLQTRVPLSKLQLNTIWTVVQAEKISLSLLDVSSRPDEPDYYEKFNDDMTKWTEPFQKRRHIHLLSWIYIAMNLAVIRANVTSALRDQCMSQHSFLPRILRYMSLSGDNMIQKLTPFMMSRYARSVIMQPTSMTHSARPVTTEPTVYFLNGSRKRYRS